MDVVVRPSEDAVGARAAALVLDAVAEDPELVLGVATGSTPLPTYQALAAARGSGTDFSRLRCVALDEYVGLGESDPGSYRCYVRTQVVEPLGLAPGRVAVPEGDGSAFEETLLRWGGVGVQLLGIGRNGHLGFNEPASPVTSRTRVVTLSESTRRDNARFFDRLADVPHQAVTQGLGTILEARHLVLLATGAAKAAAVAAALHGPVTEQLPASVLQRHPRVTVILDPPAAARL